MMRAAPRFEFVTETAPAQRWQGFARAVLRRLSWRGVLLSAGTIFLLNIARDIGQSFNAPGDDVSELKSYLYTSAVILTCQSLALLMGVLAADEAVERGARRVPAYVGCVVAACLAASIAQYFIRLPIGLPTRLSGEQFLVSVTQPAVVFVDQVILSSLATFVHVSLRTARLAAARRRATEIARLETRRRTLESKLQAMQARVEPQFLFNTLAQVRELYETDSAKAGKMLDDLIAYLRAALPHLRESSSTLGKESALASAYLDIVRVRLGDRLAFDIAAPPALAAARLPPMMLLPLIDHALSNRLDRSQVDGAIRMEATVQHGNLRLRITDTGAGFLPGGGDTDVRSIGDRLHALYGQDALFRLERLSDRGTQVILEIPYEIADRSDR